MKNQTQILRRPMIWLVTLCAATLFFIQCTEEDKIEPLSMQDVTGDYTINTEDGTWRFDKSHSSVRWQTAYVGSQALLTGRFNSFGASVNFDQANLENSSISGWVVLSTMNTGEPGRDGLGKCGPRSLGVKHNGDTLSNGSLDPDGIIAESDSAFFSSNSIVAFGNAYKATGTFDFNGVSTDVDLVFSYITEADYSNPPDGSNVKASFSGEFDFPALTVYNVGSSSIADLMNVNINANFRKN